MAIKLKKKTPVCFTSIKECAPGKKNPAHKGGKMCLADATGFEPVWELPPSCFPGKRHRPLGHAPKDNSITRKGLKNQGQKRPLWNMPVRSSPGKAPVKRRYRWSLRLKSRRIFFSMPEASWATGAPNAPFAEIGSSGCLNLLLSLSSNSF